MKLIISRCSKGGGFALAHGTKLTIDKTEHVYLRWMEQGVLMGLGDKVVAASKGPLQVTQDCIVTHSDILRLTAASLSRQRTDDLSIVYELQRSLLQLHGGTHFTLFCSVDKNNSVSLHSVGFEVLQIDMNSLVQSLIRIPTTKSPFDLGTAVANLDAASQLEIQQQIELLNKLPAQFTTRTSDPNSLGLPMHMAWHRLAPKHFIIHHSHNISLIETSFKNTLGTSHQMKKTRPTETTIVTKKSKPNDLQQFLRRFQKRTGATRLSILSSQINNHMQQFRPELTCVEVFQKELPVRGHIRVTKLSPKSITVIWNKFDSVTSEYLLTIKRGLHD